MLDAFPERLWIYYFKNIQFSKYTAFLSRIGLQVSHFTITMEYIHIHSGLQKSLSITTTCTLCFTETLHNRGKYNIRLFFIEVKTFEKNLGSNDRPNQ